MSAEIEDVEISIPDENGVRYLEIWMVDGTHRSELLNDVVDSILHPADELEAMQAENAEARRLLETKDKRIEKLVELWKDYTEWVVDQECALAFCPVCKAEQSHGHDPDCELAAALLDKKEGYVLHA